MQNIDCWSFCTGAYRLHHHDLQKLSKWNYPVRHPQPMSATHRPPHSSKMLLGKMGPWQKAPVPICTEISVNLLLFFCFVNIKTRSYIFCSSEDNLTPSFPHSLLLCQEMAYPFSTLTIRRADLSGTLAIFLSNLAFYSFKDGVCTFHWIQCLGNHWDMVD